MKNNCRHEKPYNVKELYEAKLDAIRPGDMKSLCAIDDKIFYAKLDPADPEYTEKVNAHKKHMRLRSALLRAKEVLKATGDPLNFDDMFVAINEAIDRAVTCFEHISCPKHAADLLGLIECRSLLLDAESKSADDPDDEEAVADGD